jgi:uncharacterized membrane protein
MAEQTIYPTTHQGVRDLDNPMQTAGRPQRAVSTRPQNVGQGERAASVLMGGIVVGYGLWRRDLTGLLIAAVSTGLICRGVTGHCAVYEAAGINTAQ